MKRSTQLAELKTEVKHNTLHKVTVRGALGTKMVVNRTKKSLRRITWVKTTHWKYNRTNCRHFDFLLVLFFSTESEFPHA